MPERTIWRGDGTYMEKGTNVRCMRSVTKHHSDDEYAFGVQSSYEGRRQLWMVHNQRFQSRPEPHRIESHKANSTDVQRLQFLMLSLFGSRWMATAENIYIEKCSTPHTPHNLLPLSGKYDSRRFYLQECVNAYSWTRYCCDIVDVWQMEGVARQMRHRNCCIIYLCVQYWSRLSLSANYFVFYLIHSHLSLFSFSLFSLPYPWIYISAMRHFSVRI